MGAGGWAHLHERLARVRRGLDRAGTDALIVTHLPNLAYLTAFTGSAGILIVTRDRCWLITDARYLTAVDALLESTGNPGRVTVVKVDRTVDETLADVVVRLGPIRVGFEAAHVSVKRHERLRQVIEGAPADARPRLVATDRIVERIRRVKDAREIETLRTAARMLATATPAILDLALAASSERDVAARIDGLVREAGFARPAFDTIVASGPNSALPHAHPTGRRLEHGDLVVLDFGGVYDGYCVDLTRTVGVGGTDRERRRLHDAVAAAHAAAIAAVRPGALASDVDSAARGVLEARGLGSAFAHGTGHGLGLEIHEEPRLGRRWQDLASALAVGADAPLEPGMVFTIEPGVYVPGLAGVRIEDDVLVTPRGCEILTEAPRGLDWR